MPQPLALIELEPPGNPKCRFCDVTMRLCGVERHPALHRTELWTYVCPDCDEMQTAAVSDARLTLLSRGPGNAVAV
jgi:hypothetical protein